MCQRVANNVVQAPTSIEQDGNCSKESGENTYQLGEEAGPRTPSTVFRRWSKENEEADRCSPSFDAVRQKSHSEISERLRAQSAANDTCEHASGKGSYA